jgi:predicted permease
VPFAVALDASPDLRILFATAAVTAGATLAFALGPALRLVRSDALAAVKAQAGQLAAGSGRLSWRNLLVVGQLAMSLALLTAAGLFVRGAFDARSATPGFPLEGGLVADVDLSLAGYAESRGREACRETMTRLRALPGVEAASVASSIPFGVEASFRGVRRIEQSGNQEPAWGGMVVIGADYFKTMKLSLLRGREFTQEEEERPSPVRPVIVDAAMARRLWPDADPISRQIQVEDDGGNGEWTSPMEIVGVVAGVRDSLFDRDPGPHVYVPFGSNYSPTLHLHLRAASSLSLAGTAMTDAVRHEIRAADPALPILAVRTLTEHRDTSVYLWVARAAAQVFGAFGLAALVLATLGVYGVKAYLVARRTREIGIRVALGATRLDVLRLVLGDGCWLMTAGLLVGTALSLALSKVLASWVFGVDGIQLSVLFAAGLVLAAATLLASYLPARRATAMAPLAALRTE